MKVRTHTWKVPRTVHVTEMGPNAEEASLIWIVLHGYAQSTDELVPEFKSFANNDLVIIPEGLSKFYRKGYDGEVVASWMTSKHRLDEIQDQQTYLNSIYDQISPFANHKIVVLGFSQGTATGLRWMDQNHPGLHSMVVYAGWPPEEIDFSKNYWGTVEHYYILGDNDYFLTPERVGELKGSDYFTNCEPCEINYQGEHKVSKKVLEKLRSQILSTS